MRRLLHSLLLVVLAGSVSARVTHSENPYPNELPGFKFYAKYLNPLRPYISDGDSVVRTLRSDQGLELPHWWIAPLFVGEGSTADGHSWPENVKGYLATIVIRPKRRVSMVTTKFPTVFAHDFGGISETNVTCDVYRDNFGLEYWLHSTDSPTGKKGDLIQILYGPSDTVRKSVEGR